MFETLKPGDILYADGSINHQQASGNIPKFGVPLLDIPSIESMLQLKIMSVDEIIKTHEKFSGPRNWAEDLRTMWTMGAMNLRPTWMGINGNISY